MNRQGVLDALCSNWDTASLAGTQTQHLSLFHAALEVAAEKAHGGRRDCVEATCAAFNGRCRAARSFQSLWRLANFATMCSKTSELVAIFRLLSDLAALAYVVEVLPEATELRHNATPDTVVISTLAGGAAGDLAVFAQAALRGLGAAELSYSRSGSL